MRLTGRDERGFAVGSYQARQAERLYRRAAEMERAEAQLEPVPTPPTETKTERLNKLLLYREDASPKEKTKARRAAAALGVDVPEWAAYSLGRAISQEHREKISAAVRERHRRRREARRKYGRHTKKTVMSTLTPPPDSSDNL